MKKFLFIILLSLCLLNHSKATDISDFKIEGMAVGDSLLDYFDESEIKSRLFQITRQATDLRDFMPLI